MELVCIKYNEKMYSEDASCNHPDDYCKFRTSCVIHFMETEKKNDHGLAEEDSDHESKVQGKK